MGNDNRGATMTTDGFCIHHQAMLKKVVSDCTRSGEQLRVSIDLRVTVDPAVAKNLEAEIGQMLDELCVADRIRIDRQ